MTIEQINKTISLPSVELKSNGLIVTEHLDESKAAFIAGHLIYFEGACAWWWGDFLNHLNGQYEEAIKLSGLNYDYLRHCKMVCRAFPLNDRVAGLSFTHHREALAYSADPAEALTWLIQAAAENWSVADMRKAIRQSKDQTPDENISAPFKSSVLENILELKNYYSKENPREWDFERASLFLEDFEWVVEILEVLKNKYLINSAS